MSRAVSAGLLVLLGIGVARASTFTVINTNDSGAGSLRQAITDANSNPGVDMIAFNIPGAGVHTITPLSGLPAFTETATIDGYTQPTATTNTLPTGDNANLLIELNGTNAGGGVNGLTVSANNCTIRGLVINRFSRDGIQIDAGFTGNLIAGNFIGTNVNGTAAAPNLNSGILVLGNTNTIGGTAPAARNLISGNGGVSPGNGIRLEFANNNLVEGNIIGLDRNGVNVIANQENGISDISGASNTFGGAAVGAGNLISGNKLNGIVVQDVAGATTGTGTLTLIAGNLIGTDVTGTLDRGNGMVAGVLLVQVTKVTVGGTTAGASNLLSGNDGDGVQLVLNANGNLIQGNLISGNSGAGVKIEDATSTGNAIEGNSIFSNGSLGIDLNPDGVTLNDTGDGDTGANNLQNFPVLTSVTNSGGMTHISGSLNSTANTQFTIEFFANDQIDPSGYGEGQVFVGSTKKTTNPSGNVVFNVSFPQIAAG
jgi:hypothetical protein